MIKSFLSIVFAVIVTGTFAQQTVSAAKIMDQIRKGQDISYENVTISGILDFTYHYSKADKYGDYNWWNGSNTVNEDIEVKISFVNCKFEDDVLAYIHKENTGYTFTADFEQGVIFQGCQFSGDAMFKYSSFDQGADFSGSRFAGENSFKYAEFDRNANFSKTIFDEDAIFKYAEFDNGVSFKSAEFKQSLDIKYLDVNGLFEIDRMEVGKEIDAKYTEINGESFTKYLYLSKRN